MDKIDRNHDSFVNEFELRSWIRQQHKSSLQKDSENKWKKINANKDEYLTFDELIENTIGSKDTCKSNRERLLFKLLNYLF